MFESRLVRTLGAYNSKPLGLQGYLLNVLKDLGNPNFIVQDIKKSLAAFLMHFMLGQNTPKSYHNMWID